MVDFPFVHRAKINTSAAKCNVWAVFNWKNMNYNGLKAKALNTAGVHKQGMLGII